MYVPVPNKEFPGWVEIPGYSQYLANKKGHLLNKKTKYSTKGGNAGRYLKVSVYKDGDDIATLQHVHDLICRAYWGAPVGAVVVKHKNDKRWDNRPSNLEWGTQSDNIKETYTRGIRKPTYGKRVSNEDHDNDVVYTLGNLIVEEQDFKTLLSECPITYLPSGLLSRLPNAFQSGNLHESFDEEKPVVLYRNGDNQLSLVDGYQRLGQHLKVGTNGIPAQVIDLPMLDRFGFNDVVKEKPIWTDW